MDRYPHKLYKVVVTDESENDYGQTIPGNRDTVLLVTAMNRLMEVVAK